ncbi:MAG: hypothetical protein K8F60_03455 [Melioribacteraceae bacterium]|nr:hypothetical protein [Melioribacteraceae bacterium]
MSENKDIKFSICAMFDLLGFSSHLELSAYDFRTNVGKQALDRLEYLESAIEIFNSEKNDYPDYYPIVLNIQRINDALFLTIDLDDSLIPSVGRTSFKGLNINDYDKIFTKEELENEGQFIAAYQTRINESIQPLHKFIGLVSRIHLYINKLENDNHFPGVKTVVATGFRRPFVSKTSNEEDFFSANFALSNVFIAEKELHGPNLYVDNNILQMLSFDKYARNILRFAHFIFRESAFDCFKDNEDVFSFISEPNIPDPIKIILFRKEFIFRRLNPSPLTYLQNLPKLNPYLKKEKIPSLENIFYKHILNAIEIGISKKTLEKLNPPPSFIFNGTNDLSNEIVIFLEYLEDGKSKTKEVKDKLKFEEELELRGIPKDHKVRKEIEDLRNQVVELDVEPLKIGEMGDAIYSLSEKDFTNLLIFFEGDFESLDYKNNEND